MTLRCSNPTNGFLRFEFDGRVLLCDPWLSEGIYDGGWSPYPPMIDTDRAIAGATHLFISHIHEDHFDLRTIDRLGRNILVLLPEVYPHHVMKRSLEKMGFHRIEILPLGKSHSVEAGFNVEVIPPMNAFGQTENAYRDPEYSQAGSIAIDTGLILRAAGKKVVLLSDNFPYNLQADHLRLTEMSECDLLAFAYNGLASDHPFCYVDVPDDECRQIIRDFEAKRHAAIDNFIQVIHPRLLLPYSSDFAVNGPAALRFAELCSDWWCNKADVARRYSAHHAIPAVYLYEGDWLEFGDDGEPHRWDRSQRDIPTLRDIETKHYSASTTTSRLFHAASETAEEIHGLIRQASSNLFAFMERLHLRTDWVFGIRSLDRRDWPDFFVDLETQSVSTSVAEGRKLLLCEIDSGYLKAVLEGRSHWSNARLSFQLKWHRIPNRYDDALHKAINFFHLPRTVARESS